MKFSRRELVLLVIAIMLLGGLVYYYAFFAPYSARVSVIEEELSKAQERKDTLQFQKAEIPVLQEKILEQKTELAKQTQVVSYGFNFSDTLIYLQNALTGTSNTSIVFNEPIPSGEGYTLQPVSVQFTITGYANLYSVLNHLQYDKYLIRYEIVKIDANVADETTVLTFRPSPSDAGSNIKVSLQLQIYCVNT